MTLPRAAAAFPVACPHKARGRPLASDTLALMDALADVLEEQHPMSVRGAFYAASVAGRVPKTEAGYTKVQRLLVRMRKQGLIPWGWITDGTRWRRGPRTFDGVEEALEATAHLYRRSLWDRAPARLEVWLEKEALAGVLFPVTNQWTVDLMVCKGYPSLSFLHEAAEAAKAANKPLIVYYLGDLDPSGKDIPRTIRQRFRDFGADVELRELAVTRDQAEDWRLPTRPTKQTDARAAGFDGDSVELDAIPPDRLRALVENAIRGHVDLRQVELVETVEHEEREVIYRLASEAA